MEGSRNIDETRVAPYTGLCHLGFSVMRAPHLRLNQLSAAKPPSIVISQYQCMTDSGNDKECHFSPSCTTNDAIAERRTVFCEKAANVELG